MNTFLLRFALALVRSWTRLYTAGLAPTLRHARRAEIDCDLWEHEREAFDSGVRTRVAFDIFFRWLLGAPDDLAWRWASAGQLTIWRKTVPVILGGLTICVAGMAFAAMVIDNIQYMQESKHIIPGDVLMALSITLAATGFGFILIGFGIMKRVPGFASLLVVTGSVTVGILFFWLIAPLVAAVALSAYGLYKAGRIRKQRDVSVV
ncbi:MAG: hypothetical protein O2854_05670 [Chloroflexi bacterium]|nr:hypothetical protein [Chloroflexota bacterium]